MTTFDVDDAALWYDVAGEGDLLIALHGGLGLDHTTLRPWLDPLAQDVRLAYLDFRANGRSTGSGEDITMRRLAEDVDALREHLGAERTWLLGHSYGGFVALEYALAFPDRLHGLVLLDTDSTGPTEQSVAGGLQRLGVPPEEMAAFGLPTETQEDVLRFFEATGPWYLPHSPPEAMAPLLADLIYSRAGSEGGDRALAGWDVGERLAEISAPTLVLSGVDDFLFSPETTRRLASGLADGTAVVVDGAGHLPYVEQQDVVLDAIRRQLGLAQQAN
ncbi:MAG TPA: alpha/beta hydrolase [Nocardioides sp.]|nr:alpha/beta hydrolase [Nocardioides sp.]